VKVERPGVLRLEYSLEAHLSRVRLPIAPDFADSTTRGAGNRTDGLWKHTCFEAFVVTDTAPGYLELNFAPSLDWSVYVFSSYREGMRPADVGRPEISVQRDESRFVLEASTRLDALMQDARRPAQRIRLALSAVIEDDNGRLSYWALRHAPGKPDFHHPDAFALELEI
jgi:hypothetical protein